MFRAPASTAKALAAALMAASPIAGAFPVAAQDAVITRISNTCAKYTDPASNAQCVFNERIAINRARIASGQAKIAADNAEIDCAETLKAGLVAKAIRPEDARALLNGKTTAEYGACRLLAQLTKS